MKKGLALFAALLLVLITVTPAGAITGGQPDGNGHPYGALLLVPGYTFCSGTLIAVDVVLTAGHCTSFFSEFGASEVMVTFDSVAGVDRDFWTITGGTWYTVESVATHPDYVDAQWPFTVDFGVVILSEPVTGITPADLPYAGLVDELIGTTGQTDERFLDVGYGQDGVNVGGGQYRRNFSFIRKYSIQRFNPSAGSVGTLDPRWLILGNVPSDNKGSGCGGDSGSGIFSSSVQDTLVAVHTGGYRMGYLNRLCGRITSLNHRLDLPVVLDWLQTFLDD